ncbi:MAG: hypothetical protein EP343_10330 [Deltaproteobacteria bacterium]|nr:MAG: hypothetical protein EP343_10330 [Deltaproteobacteria bacterium]
MKKRDYRVRVYRWVDQPPVRWCECIEESDDQVDDSGELVLPTDATHQPFSTMRLESGEYPRTVAPRNFRQWVSEHEAQGDLKESTHPSVPSVEAMMRLSHSTSYASISHIRAHYLSESSDTSELSISILDLEKDEVKQ